MKHRIIGDSIQTVAVELEAGESVFGRLGTLLFVRGAVKSETDPKGAYWAGVTGSMTREGEPPLVVYTCESGGGLVGFRTPCAGRIFALGLAGSTRVVVRRNAVLAASEGVQCDPLHLEGEEAGEVPEGVFVTLSGSGQAFLHGPGNLVDFTLAADERMVVDGAMILAVYDEIDMSPRPVGKPGKAGLAGKAGPEPYIMLMHLTGPGRAILHTLPPWD